MHYSFQRVDPNRGDVRAAIFLIALIKKEKKGVAFLALRNNLMFLRGAFAVRRKPQWEIWIGGAVGYHKSCSLS